MSGPSDLVSAIRSMAAGTSVDWQALDEAPVDASVSAVLGELKVIAAIAQAHGANIPSDDSLSEDGEVGLQSWGALTLIERIGEGAYGIVYRAWDSRLDREVALKLLRIGRTQESDTPTIEEGRLLARVNHPNVVTVHGADRIDGRVGIWMEFVQGHTLEELIQRDGPLPANVATRIGIEVAKGLDAVHRAGIVHRDVKAQNVMVQGDGRVVLMDFGSGHAIEDARGGAAGTPLYVAPEVLAGAPATACSDIYSLGVLLFFLLSGRYPRAGQTVADLRQQDAGNMLVRFTNPEVPAHVARIIDRALAPETRRWQSAGDVARALSGGRIAGRRWTIAAVATAIMVPIGLGAWWLARGPVFQADGTQHVPSVLVSTFQNNTDDPQLEEVTRRSFERELANTDGIRLVPDARVAQTLALMRRDRPVRLGPDIAREVALRDGEVDAVIVGKVDRAGNGVVVSAAAVDPVDGAILFSVAEPSTPTARVDTTVRQEVELIRQGLSVRGVISSHDQPKLRRVTSSSLRAVQLYSEAASLYSEQNPNWDHVAVQRRLEAALLEDPEFASAHILLAHAIFNQTRECNGCAEGRPALAHAERAMALAADPFNATSVERNFILGSGHSFRARYAGTREQQNAEQLEAIAGWDAALREDPEFPWALRNIEVAYWQLARPREFAVHLAKLADATPDNFRLNAEAAFAAPEVEDETAADRFAARAERLMTSDQLRRHPESAARLKLLLIRRAWLKDDVHETLQRLITLSDEAEQSNPALSRWVTTYGFYTALTLGRLHDAEVRVARFNEGSLHDVNFVRLLKQRRDSEGLRTFLAPRVGTAVAPNIGIAWAENGFFDEARRIAGISTAYRALEIEESIAVNEHRAQDAVALADQIFPHLPFGDGHVQMSMMTADALVELGRNTDAILMLESTTAHRAAASEIGGYRWMNARAQLADLYRNAGREAEARAIEEHLLRLLAVADPDFPLLVHLKARVAARGGRLTLSR